MRVPQAKGELRTAHLEIDGLNQEKAALTQALTTKAKEVRLQVLQVGVRFVFSVHAVVRNCISLPYRVFISCEQNKKSRNDGRGRGADAGYRMFSAAGP